jgi:DNA recombination protein RmuC
MPLSLSEISLPASVSLATAITVAAVSVFCVALLLSLWHLRKQQKLTLELNKSQLSLSARELENSQAQQKIAALQTELEHSVKQTQQAQQQLAGLQAQLTSEQKAAEEKLALLTKTREQDREELRNQFENTAQKIFDNKSKQFGERSQEQIGQLLNPFAEQLKGFKQTVEQKFETEGKERASLQGEIKALTELNQQISAEANALTNALSGQNKVQGNWGEIILKTVLEQAGLSEGLHFDQQTTERNDENTIIRPDVVLYLPQDRIVVIDSKVSLTAYSAYCNAEGATDKKQQLDLHVRSIRQHIDGLSKKRYETAYPGKTLDFVFMFMPIDQAYLDATQADLSLIAYGLEKKVVIVSPYSLYPNLKTVEMLWRNHEQNQNAVEIARVAGTLYDKIADSENDLQKVKASLQKAQDQWDSAWSRLATGKGNALRTAERLRDLGVKTRKQISHDESERFVEPPAGND